MTERDASESLAPRQAVALMLAVVAVVVLYTTAVVGYEAAALELRQVGPHDVERQGSDYDHFVFWAKVGFFSIYAGLVVISAAIGYAAFRWAGGNARRAAGLMAALAIAIGAVTFPFVEFLNACHVGVSFVLDASC